MSHAHLEVPKIILPAKGVKCLGTREKPAIKVIPISDLKVHTTKAGVVVMRGYANTKGHADRYGDIPTVFSELRNYVYELTNFRKNPVMLVDHNNSATMIAGSFKELEEDELGLRFMAEFSKSDFAPVKHVREVYSEGHGRALSIAGRFYYEDKDNFDFLTYADIFEISVVAVGADPEALGDADPGKSVEEANEEADEAVTEVIEEQKESEESEREALVLLNACAQPSVSEDEVKEVLEKINGLLA